MGSKPGDPDWMVELENTLTSMLYDSTRRELEKNAGTAMERRRVAQLEARLERLRADSAAMQRQLGAKGEGFGEEEGEGKVKKKQRLTRRMWHCMIAGGGGEGDAPVGSCTISMFTPDAALPPPFPTLKPEKFYVSNMAVLPESRRQGVARRLLGAAEVLARRWGRDEVYLHVDIGNTGALAMYEDAGYRVISEDPWYFSLVFTKRRLLMRKRIASAVPA